MVTYHHLVTRKSHPEFAFEKWNMIPVCQKAHNDFHAYGITYMAKKYDTVKIWLEKNNWYFCEFMKKWKH